MATATDPAAWGITPGYHHVDGHWVVSPRRGVEAALAAMASPPSSNTWVVDRRRGLDLPWPAELRTEDGSALRIQGHVLPDDLPLGYHWLEPAHGSERVSLIVSPGICPLPPRMSGWAVQLYAARSRASWGIGDLGDLGRLTARSSLVLINPLHAVAPTMPQQPSPYMPASRRWRNPIYLRIEDVPSALGVAGVAELAGKAKALNHDRMIDRDAVWHLKRSALELVWAQTGPPPELNTWMETAGVAGFATWAALTDEHGADWRRWPSALQTYGDPAVKAWAASHRDQVMFHAWLQWLIIQQLSAATADAIVAGDLAIGVDPAGADAWQWPDVLATGVTIGAPPDDFNPHGQDWGMPPFDPWRLQAAGYEPFVEVVRAACAGMSGVRIDHVAGLFRTFWVPPGGNAADGVYVRYPWHDLLNIVALEAHRAGAFVVGEDLGTIEPEVRDALAARNVLSYRLLWFEQQPPAQWPELALAAVTTHDLPTVAGVWLGIDDPELRPRLRIDDGALPVATVVERVYAELAAAPPLLVLGTLDDALEVEERPNHPGTTDEYPNWSLALPLPLEEIEEDPRVLKAAAALDR